LVLDLLDSLTSCFDSVFGSILDAVLVVNLNPVTSCAC
jgi:hypothetical protein